VMGDGLSIEEKFPMYRSATGTWCFYIRTGQVSTNGVAFCISRWARRGSVQYIQL
jgi:hypothetical protein